MATRLEQLMSIMVIRLQNKDINIKRPHCTHDHYQNFTTVLGANALPAAEWKGPDLG